MTEGATTGLRPALVPRFGPLPPGWGWVVVSACVLAWILCLPASADPTLLAGGRPDLPGLSHTTSQMAFRGPAFWAHSRMVMFPGIHNLYSQMSFPADGLPGAPFIAVLGWPAGFTAFTVATLAALGVSTGLFVASWWRSVWAGLIAVVAAESSGVVLREITEGRLTHVLGLVFAPMAVAWYARAVVEDRGRSAVWAGMAVGASALVFWYQAVWVGLMLLVIFAAGLGERLPVFRHMAWGAAGTFVVAGFPMLYTVLHAGAHPGNEVGAWSTVEEIPGMPMMLIELLEQRDAGGMGWLTGAWAFRPLLVALCLAGLWRARARRVFAPVVWIVVAWALGAGPILALPGATILSPIFAQSLVPLMRRYWWPDRYLLVATIGVAVLAGGAMAWLAGRLSPRMRVVAVLGLSAALLVEAEVTLRSLPIAGTHGSPSERVEVMARGSGPTFVVPVRDLSPDAANRVWSSENVLDQVHHRRPLVTGLMNPEAVVAAADYREFWAKGALRAIRDCEDAVNDAPEALAAPLSPELERSLDALYRAGVREIYGDPSLEGPPAIATPWRACVNRLLGEPVRQEGPLLVYELRPPQGS